jgi:agmatine deiminase
MASPVARRLFAGIVGGVLAATLVVVLIVVAVNAPARRAATPGVTTKTTTTTMAALDNNGWAAPAEWEPQQSLWFIWPTFEFIAGYSPVAPMMTVMRTVTTEGAQRVDLIVASDAEERAAKSALRAAGANLTRVRFIRSPHTDFWLRDYAMFLKNRNTGALAVVGFDFNCWGMGNQSVSLYFNSASKTDRNIDRNMAAALGLEFRQIARIAEQGGLEFNGNGVLIASEAVLLQAERNPGVSKAQMTRDLTDFFNLRTLIWLPKFRTDAATGREVILPESDPAYYYQGGSGSLVVDDSTFYGALPNEDPARPADMPPLALTALTTNGHTDEYVRFINSDTVLLAEVPRADLDSGSRIAQRTADRLEAIRSVLVAAGLKVLRIPTAPDRVFYLQPGDATYDGYLNMHFTAGPDAGTAVLDLFPGNPSVDGRAAAYAARSYLNYVLTNQHVFVPAYPEPEAQASNDRAQRVLRRAFPTRTVVPVADVDAVNIGGGGLHCITQHMPL